MSDDPSFTTFNDDASAWIDPPPGTEEARQKRKPDGPDADGGRNDGFRDHRPGDEYTSNRVFIRRTTLRDEKDSPRRPWIAPGFLIRKAVTLLFGPPDQGKSLLLVAWAVALALGRLWGSFEPNAPMKVPAILAEEDDDEQEARFAAALRAFGVTRADVEFRLRRLVVSDLATLLEADRMTGVLTPTKGWDDLRNEVEAFRPDVVIADPLIEFHTAEENDNTRIKAVISWFRSLARTYGLAVLLSHHSRKGEQVPGSLEMARGASATGGAVRIAYTFLEALEQYVLRLGIAPKQRRWFCRLDRAKASQSPPTVDDADWLEKIAYPLDNGDETPALRPWEPPPVVTPDQMGLAKLITEIGRGCPQSNGEPWSPQLRNTDRRSIRTLLRKHGVDARSEKITLTALYDLGVVIARFRRPRRSNPYQGLRTKDRLPAAAWVDAATGDG